LIVVEVVRSVQQRKANGSVRPDRLMGKRREMGAMSGFYPLGVADGDSLSPSDERTKKAVDQMETSGCIHNTASDQGDDLEAVEASIPWPNLIVSSADQVNSTAFAAIHGHEAIIIEMPRGGSLVVPMLRWPYVEC
jgi:hypothetical protein